MIHIMLLLNMDWLKHISTFSQILCIQKISVEKHHFILLQNMVNWQFASLYLIMWVTKILNGTINGLHCMRLEKLHTLKLRAVDLSQLVAHSRIFRLFIKGKFKAYLLWPLAKRVQSWIVDLFTSCDFMVNIKRFGQLKMFPFYFLGC